MQFEGTMGLMSMQKNSNAGNGYVCKPEDDQDISPNRQIIKQCGILILILKNYAKGLKLYVPALSLLTQNSRSAGAR